MISPEPVVVRNWRDFNVDAFRHDLCAERSCSTCLQSTVSWPHHSSAVYWLPVQFHIKFKLCLLMHQIHVRRCPAYLAELVSSSAENCLRSGLRSTSTSTSDYSKPRLRIKFAERAFSFSGPAEWNCLPNDLRMITDTNVLKGNSRRTFINRHFVM